MELIRKQIQTQVWKDDHNRLRGIIQGQVLDQVKDQVRNRIWDQVRDQVCDLIVDHICDQRYYMERNEANIYKRSNF